MYCPDNYDAFVAHEERKEREHQELLKRLPKCSKCKRKILDEDCYEIGGNLYCEECIENSKVLTDDYMEE